MNVEPIFMLKKVLTVIVMPWSIAIIFSLIALFFIYQNKLTKAKIYLTISILLSITISWAPFTDRFIKPLESQYSRLETIPNNVDYILLLGGDRERRAWEALRLYHKAPRLTIITSGYSLHDHLSDAQKTATLLIESGIPKEKIRLQENVKTTYEESLEMKKLVGNKPFLLVTSAYHMQRSMQLFQKQGLNPIPAPANFNREEESGFLTTLQSNNLEDTEHAWHEYLGILLYKLQGKI